MNLRHHPIVMPIRYMIGSIPPLSIHRLFQSLRRPLAIVTFAVTYQMGVGQLSDEQTQESYCREQLIDTQINQAPLLVVYMYFLSSIESNVIRLDESY